VASGVVIFVVVLLALSPSLDPIAVITGHGFDVDVPKITGQTQTQALLTLDRIRLKGNVSFVYSSTVARGIVVAQSPRPHGQLRRGTSALVAVSRGPDQVAVPTVIGEPVAQARRDLGRLGLSTKAKKANDETVPAGSIVSQLPTAGTVVSGGDVVHLVVSSGPVIRTVPNTAGIALEGALFTIGKAGLALGTVSQADNPTVPADAVISTDPAQGALVPRDTPVNVVVSNGPPPVAVPNLVGGQQTNAASQLSALGLVAGEVSSYGQPDDPQDGLILDQNPPAGTMVKPGQVVTLTVRRAALMTTTTTTTTVAVPPPAPGPGG
jgi:serine/threonine-protein kinase